MFSLSIYEASLNNLVHEPRNENLAMKTLQFSLVKEIMTVFFEEKIV